MQLVAKGDERLLVCAHSGRRWSRQLFDWKGLGEPGWIRTYNQQIKSLLLCQLSYGPARSGCSASRTASTATRLANQDYSIGLHGPATVEQILNA